MAPPQPDGTVADFGKSPSRQGGRPHHDRSTRALSDEALSDLLGTQRFGAPDTGRLNSPDPSGQERNPCPYAEGDPADPDGLLSLGIGGEACFRVRGGAGVSINEDGGIHPYVGAGVGASPASGPAGQGRTGEGACGFGPLEASVATDGSEGVGTGGSSGRRSGDELRALAAARRPGAAGSSG